MTDSGESTGFSDTESKDENEEVRVSDPISSHEDMEKVNNQKNQDTSGASSENFHLLILLQGTMQFSTLQYPILHVNYP